MVRLSRWYLALAVLVAALFAVPATRQALTREPFVGSLAWDESMLLGLGAETGQREPAEVAAELGEAWAYAAAAELQPLGSAPQLALLDQAAELAPTDPELLLRRAELVVGAAFQQDGEPEVRLVAAAERALADLPEAARGNAAALLLQAVVDSRRPDWTAVATALEAAAGADVHFPYQTASQHLARLLRACGLTTLEANAQATIGLLLPDLQGIRRMADAVASRVAALRAAGREREAAKLALSLARAGGRLYDGETSMIAALVGIAVTWSAFDAGEPELVVPDSVKGTADEPWWLPRARAERFARRLAALQMAEEAAWVRAESEVARRVKAAVRQSVQQFPGLGPVGRPVRAIAFWYVLAGFCVIAGLLAMPLAGLLCGAGLRPRRWLPWRHTECAAVCGLMLVVALPLAGLGAAQLLPLAAQGPPAAVQRWIGTMMLSALLLPGTLAVVCWWLGLQYARRTGAHGWRARFRAAGHFAGRAVPVPALAVQVVLLTLALLCAVPLAWQRQQAASAFGDVFAYESQLVADAVAGRPLDLDGDRRR